MVLKWEAKIGIVITSEEREHRRLLVGGVQDLQSEVRRNVTRRNEHLIPRSAQAQCYIESEGSRRA